MKVDFIPHRLWLRRVGLGAATIVLYLPAVICTILYEIGLETERAFNRRFR